MIQIQQKNYEQIVPLLQQTAKTTPTNAWAIVQHYMEGSIFSDAENNPKAALIGSKNGTYFICGKPNQAFIDAFFTYYLKRSSSRFTLFSPNALWDEVIERIAMPNTNKMKRMVFMLEQDLLQHVSPTDYVIKPISMKSITTSPHFDKAYYQSNWGSVDKYLQHGIGFYALNEQAEVVGECTSIFRSKDSANIDIHTLPVTRGKGIALSLSQAFIVRCLKLGITPVWDCDQSNRPSLQLAKKIGFNQSATYHLYYKKML